MVDAGDLGAIDEDVPFDWHGATRLKAAFEEEMASAIEAQRGPRMDAFAGCLASWQGAAKAVYDADPRHVQGDTDAGELAAACRGAVGDIEAIERAAREEDARREEARAYVRAYEENEANEGFLDNMRDFFFGEDFQAPPMPAPPTPEPHLAPPAPAPTGGCERRRSW